MHPPGFYGRLARFVLAHKRMVLAATLLVTVIMGVFASRLRVDSDILALMPQEEASTKALKALDQEEGGINFLTIAVDADDADKRDAFMRDLSRRLEGLDEVEYVLWSLDPDVAWRLGLLQIPVEDLATIRDRLKAALTLGPAIANPFIAARLLDLGPLTAKLQEAGKGFSLTSEGGTARMIVRPRGSAHDIPFARRFMAEVNREIAAADPAASGVTVRWIGGAYRHNVEDYEGIVHDIGWITGASFLMVLAIIAAAFRTPRALAAIFAPLVLSNLWTLGVAGGTVGALNTFTSFVNAVLIGLGVEFGVHLYARYREQRVAGHNVDDAIVRAWDFVGGACTSAALTSAAGFAALIAAHFAGFRQLGWLLSLGLLMCLVAEIALMPLVIHWLERDAPHVHAHHRHRRHRRRAPATYRLAPMSLMIIGSFTLVSGLLISRIEFEYDLSELRRAGLAYEDLSEDEKALARDSYAPLVVSFGTEAQLDEAYARLKKRVDDGRFPEIARVLSVRTVLPADQAERVSILEEIQALGRDPSAVYLPPAVRTNLERLSREQVRPLGAADLPVPVQHVLGANDDRHRLLLIPAGNMWDMREAARLAEAVERELPGLTVAGEYLTLGVLYKLMQRDAPVIAAIAFALVFLFTWLDLRRPRATAGAIAVLVAGMAWWGALLVLSNIRISIVNFVGIPIVLGIGIDVMIHLIHRLQQEGPGRIMKSLSTTGWASALGTSTTVVAFAALSLASSQGIRSLGLLVLLGEMAVTIAGFVLVPLGFATTWRLTGRHSLPDPEGTNPGAG
ncbi:MAG: efflux RND transporter permease subunit [Myxococcota bacterium]